LNYTRKHYILPKLQSTFTLFQASGNQGI